MTPTSPAAPDAKALDPVTLMLGSSGVVLVVLLILIVASCLVWLIWFLKSAQLRRLTGAERNFQRAAEALDKSADLVALALLESAFAIVEPIA